MNIFLNKRRTYSKFMSEKIAYFDPEYKNKEDKKIISESNNLSLFAGLEIKYTEVEFQVDDNNKNNITNTTSSIGIIGGKKQKKLSESIDINIEPTFQPDVKQSLGVPSIYSFKINDDADDNPFYNPSNDTFNNPTIQNKHQGKKVRISSDDSSKKKHYYCSACKTIFRNEDTYKEHMIKHNNLSENAACVCKICCRVFQSDEDYFNHRNDCKENRTQTNISEENIENIQNNVIPENPLGIYICPVCDKRYDNTFYLGEHFIANHDDYNVLCNLDTRNHNGFPGYKILYRMGMITKFKNKKKFTVTDEICDICCFNYTYNKSEISSCKRKEEILLENRNPLTLACCKRLICHDCLMQHIISTDSIICPFCRKDHTRDDLQYITFIDIIDTTDRTKWIPWWENHMDIFESS